jgi:hypothetical protein
VECLKGLPSYWILVRTGRTHREHGADLTFSSEACSGLEIIDVLLRISDRR